MHECQSCSAAIFIGDQFEPLVDPNGIEPVLGVAQGGACPASRLGPSIFLPFTFASSLFRPLALLSLPPQQAWRAPIRAAKPGTALAKPSRLPPQQLGRRCSASTATTASSICSSKATTMMPATHPAPATTTRTTTTSSQSLWRGWRRPAPPPPADHGAARASVEIQEEDTELLKQVPHKVGRSPSPPPPAHGSFGSCFRSRCSSV